MRITTAKHKKYGVKIMEEQIHGHEVMKIMLESGKSFTKESLCSAIVKQFGEDARFYTCSNENMTACELVEFLQSKGKFISKGNGFSTSNDKICNH